MAGRSQDCLKINNYILRRTIGKGAFAKVMQAEHEDTKQEVAVKILHRQKISMAMEKIVEREIEIHMLIKHPHIIELFHVVRTSADIFMLMEYAPNGNLHSYILMHWMLKETQVRKFFQQIISGLDYFHRQGIVHRDLKLENLLLDHDYNIKIADLGFSRKITDVELLKTHCGPLYYVAPELILDKLYAGPEVDIWACGVILYCLLCGALPFNSMNRTRLGQNIIKGSFTIPDKIVLSENLVELIHHMLQPDRVKRATVEEIKKNEWFKTDLPDYLFPTAIKCDAS